MSFFNTVAIDAASLAALETTSVANFPATQPVSSTTLATSAKQDSSNTFGATATRGRIQSSTNGYAGFVIFESNPSRKQYHVLSHGNGNFHLFHTNSVPTDYESPIELMGAMPGMYYTAAQNGMHEGWVEDVYTGKVYGRFHEPEETVTKAVTFQVSTDTVTSVAHGRINGVTVSFTVITTTTGISINTTYYVVQKTDDTFKLSLTVGGNAIDLLTNDGTGTMVTSIPLTGFINYSETST